MVAGRKNHHEFSILIPMAIATADYSHLCDRTDCLNPYHGPLDLGNQCLRVQISIGKHTEDGDM